MTEINRVNRSVQAHIDALEERLSMREAELQRLRTALVFRYPSDRHNLYRILAQNLPDMAVLLYDHQLRFVVAEGPALEQQGFNTVDLEGKTVADVLPPEQSATLIPFYRSALQGESATFEMETAGRTYYVYSVPVRDGQGAIVGGMVVSQDITARKQLENEREALIKMATALRTPLDHSRRLDTVFDLILEQVVKVVHSQSANILLPVAGDPGTVYVARFRGYDYRPQAQDAMLALRLPIDLPNLKRMTETGQPLVVPHVKDHVDWHNFPGLDWVRSYAGAPLRVDDNVIGFLNVDSERPGALHPSSAAQLQTFADFAALAIHNARLYAELSDALEHEKAMRNQLMRSEHLASMGRMVASVAHELNNPLQTIENSLFLLQGGNNGPSAEQCLTIALSETRRLAELVNQLRRVYQPGRATDPTAVSLDTLLADVRVLLDPHLQRHSATWVQDPIPPDTAVVGVANQLIQVFANLCLNGIEAMRPHGGVLRLTVDRDEEEVRIHIVDEGPGISAEAAEHLFDPFYTTRENGLGLGLAICYDVVRQHNGRLTHSSPPGAGASFTVALPAAILADSA